MGSQVKVPKEANSKWKLMDNQDHETLDLFLHKNKGQ